MADLSIGVSRTPASAPAAKTVIPSPSQAGERASDDAFSSVLARSVETSESKGTDADGKSNDDEDDKSSGEEAGTTTPTATLIASDKPTTPPDGKRSLPGQSATGTLIINAEPERRVAGDTPAVEAPIIGGVANDQSLEQRNLPVGEKAILAVSALVDTPASAKTIPTAATLQITQPNSKAAPTFEQSRTEPIALERIAADLHGLPASGLSSSTPSIHAIANPAIHSFFGAAQFAPTQEVHHYDIQSPFSSPEWPREAGHIVRIMVTERLSEAEIRVNPPELGPIDVVLKVDGDSTTITFTADSPETRSLLEFHIPKLREALDAAGLHLADASVNSGGTQRDSRGTSGSSTFSHEYLTGTDNGPRDSTSAAGPGPNPSTRSDRLIDIFA